MTNQQQHVLVQQPVRQATVATTTTTTTTTTTKPSVIAAVARSPVGQTGVVHQPVDVPQSQIHIHSQTPLTQHQISLIMQQVQQKIGGSSASPTVTAAAPSGNTLQASAPQKPPQQQQAAAVREVLVDSRSQTLRATGVNSCQVHINKCDGTSVSVFIITFYLSSSTVVEAARSVPQISPVRNAIRCAFLPRTK